MKKIALTSLLSLFVAGAASAANIIDNNPLYRPDAGRYYSVTELGSHSEDIDSWGLREEIAYGFTDRFMAILATDVSEKDGFSGMGWNDISVGLDYRLVDMGNWKGDVFGAYTLGNVWPDHKPFMDEDFTSYKWTAGVRAGYMTANWTLAGHVAFDYTNSESFNWGDDGVHKLRAGVDGQLVLNPSWNLTAGVEYTGVLDDKIGGVDVEDAGRWATNVGVNYNLDATRFVGVYATSELAHRTGDWKFENGFGFGAKFGIDF